MLAKTVGVQELGVDTEIKQTKMAELVTKCGLTATDALDFYEAAKEALRLSFVVDYPSKTNIYISCYI